MIQRGTDRGLPHYAADDVFVLRGMGGAGAEDLVRLADGSFRFRIEGAYVRGRQLPDGSWVVVNRSGTKFRFGSAPNSVVTDGSTRTFGWHLTEQEDAHHHRISYEYELDSTGRPYLTRIVYNDFSAEARNEIAIEYASRPDAISSFVSGFEIITAKRATRIVVRHGGATVRSYDLEYDASTFLSRLSRVTMTGRDAVTALPPITFEYANVTVDAMHVVSMNTSPARSLGVTTELDDVDGDSLPDLLVMDPSLDSGAYSYYPNLDGTSFGPREVIPNTPSVWLDSENVQLADMDGDGASDVVARVSSATDGFRFYPSNTAVGFGSSVTITPNTSVGFDDPSIRLVDLNHDRLTDWIRIDSTTGSVSVGFNLGGGAFSAAVTRPKIESTEIVSFDAGARFEDCNGDGLSDILLFRSGSFRYWAARGDGYYSTARQVANAPSLSSQETADADVRDVDGDGLADIVHVGVSQVRFWRNRSARSFAAPIVVSGTPSVDANTVVRMADMNANGSTDVVWINPTNGSAPWRYLDVLGEGPPGLLTRIDNGLGKVVSISYAGLGVMRKWARETGVAWTMRSSVGQTIVASIATEDGLGARTESAYRYADAFFDARSREWRGFRVARITEIGEADQPTLISDFVFDVGNVDETRRGLELESRTSLEDGRVFERKLSTYDARTVALDASGQPIRLSRLVQRDTQLFELTSSPAISRERWDYDDFGNTTLEAKFGRVEGANESVGNDEVIIRRTFAINLSSWILDRVATERTESVSGTRLAERRTRYDGDSHLGLEPGNLGASGDVTRVEDWISGERFAVRESYARDEHGNIVEHRDGRGGLRSRAYDSVARTMVVEERAVVSDDLSLVWQAEVDLSFGIVTRVTDPNGHETDVSFDALGRPVAIAEPGDSLELPTRRFEYELAAPISYVRAEQREVSGEPGVVVSFDYRDGLGRSRARVTEREGGRWSVDAFQQFGARGWPSREDAPFFTNSGDLPAPALDRLSTRTVYDARGRSTSTVRSDGTRTRTDFDPTQRVVSDENDLDPASSHFGTPNVFTVDGLGRVVEIQERADPAPSITRLAYDGLSNLIRHEDAAGRVRSYEYDGRSRRTSVRDPNAGSWRAEFDDADGMSRRVDADGNVVEWERDTLGRVLREWHTSNGSERRTAIEMHYDVAHSSHRSLSNLLGQLAWARDDAGFVAIGYDSHGHETDRVRVWPDGHAMHAWTDFDAAGRVSRRGFPDGTHIELEYGEGGLLSSVRGLVDAVEWNAAGAVERVVFRNGVEESRLFDSRGRERRRTVAGVGGESLSDLEVGLDAASHVTSVIDHITDAASHASRSAVFEVDQRYRLSHVAHAGRTIDFTYDEVGNLTSLRRVDAGNAPVESKYEYSEGTLDRLTSVGDTVLTYDASGRVVGDGTRALSWDPKGRLSVVTSERGREESTYDLDDMRAIRRTEIEGRVTEVRTLARDIEERDGRLVRYVFLGDERAIRLDDLSHSGSATAATRSRSGSQFVGMMSSVGVGAGLLVVFTLCRCARRRMRWRIPELAWLAAATALAACPSHSRDLRSSSRVILDWPRDGVLTVFDYLGNVVGLANSDGESMPCEAFDVMGVALPGSTASIERRGFVGHESDALSGVYLFGARPYDPQLGRFLAVDPAPMFDSQIPLIEPHRFQAYSYAASRPNEMRDISGRDPTYAQVVADRNQAIVALDSAIEQISQHGVPAEARAYLPREFRGRGGVQRLVNTLGHARAALAAANLRLLTTSASGAVVDQNGRDVSNVSVGNGSRATIGTLTAGAGFLPMFSTGPGDWSVNVQSEQYDSRLARTRFIHEGIHFALDTFRLASSDRDHANVFRLQALVSIVSEVPFSRADVNNTIRAAEPEAREIPRVDRATGQELR